MKEGFGKSQENEPEIIVLTVKRSNNGILAGSEHSNELPVKIEFIKSPCYTSNAAYSCD